MLIKKILCPTDLSEDSRASIAYAISLAREHKADLVFFNVTSFPSWELVAQCDSDIGFQRRLSMFKVDGLFVSAASRVSNFVQANFGEEICGRSWEARISLGNVSREIIAAAMGMQVDLIVMAKRKRGVFLRLLAPSISAAVREKAPCPVLSLCPLQIMRHLSSWRGTGFSTALRSSEAS